MKKSNATNPNSQNGGIPRVSAPKVTSSRGKLLPEFNAIYSYVTARIIGQDEAVKRILLAIYRQLHFKTLRSVVLVVGNTGTGKTEAIKQIASQLRLPCTIEDATKYTKEGYVGSSPEEMIYNLIARANQNIELAQHGIIVVDEIDKKAGTDNEDVGGNPVLKSLLKMMEGTKVQIYLDNDDSEDLFDDPKPIMFDTSNVTFIFLGAFEGIQEIVNKRINKNPIGIAVDANPRRMGNNQITGEDLNKYGLPEEFIGRIGSLVQMEPICNPDDYEKILRCSKISILQKYKKELKNIGISLSVSKDVYIEIAREAAKKKVGARSLSTVVNRIFEKILLEIFSSPQGKYSSCKLTSATTFELT